MPPKKVKIPQIDKQDAEIKDPKIKEQLVSNEEKPQITTEYDMCSMSSVLNDATQKIYNDEVVRKVNDLIFEYNDQLISKKGDSREIGQQMHMRFSDLLDDHGIPDEYKHEYFMRFINRMTVVYKKGFESKK